MVHSRFLEIFLALLCLNIAKSKYCKNPETIKHCHPKIWPLLRVLPSPLLSQVRADPKVLYVRKKKNMKVCISSVTRWRHLTVFNITATRKPDEHLLSSKDKMNPPHHVYFWPNVFSKLSTITTDCIYVKGLCVSLSTSGHLWMWPLKIACPYVHI